MSEETQQDHNDGTWSGLKKTIVGTLGTVVAGGGVWLSTLLFGGHSEEPAQEATEKMNASAQGWNNVNNLTGGTLAYHKTKWQMIAWEEHGSLIHLQCTTTQKLRIND